MSIAKIILLVYGLLLLSGAYFGLKAGSKMSLYMGIITGLLVLSCLSLDFIKGIVFISGLLCIVFLMRLLKTKKFMPSGMLLLMSIVAAIVSSIQAF